MQQAEERRTHTANGQLAMLDSKLSLRAFLPVYRTRDEPREKEWAWIHAFSFCRRCERILFLAPFARPAAFMILLRFVRSRLFLVLYVTFFFFFRSVAWILVLTGRKGRNDGKNARVYFIAERGQYFCLSFFGSFFLSLVMQPRKAYGVLLAPLPSHTRFLFPFKGSPPRCYAPTVPS